MLSVVAGPVTVHSIDPLDSVLVLSDFGLWVDRLGFVVKSTSGSTHVSELYAVQLDGGAVRIGGKSGSNAAAPTAFGWSPTVGTARAAVVWFDGQWQEIDLPSYARKNEASTGVYGALGPFGVMQTRLIRAFFNRIIASALSGSGGGDTTEYTFASLPGGTDLTDLVYAGQVGGHHLWWAGSPTTGFVCLYDATAMAEVAGKRTKLGTGWRSMGYSVKHDVFIVHRFESSADHLYVYANEPVASSVTPPTFAGTVKRGEVVSATSTVTGLEGEPCAGRNVRFSATLGTWDPVVVATNAAGVATSTYRAPFTSGGVSDAISAELVE